MPTVEGTGKGEGVARGGGEALHMNWGHFHHPRELGSFPPSDSSWDYEGRDAVKNVQHQTCTKQVSEGAEEAGDCGARVRWPVTPSSISTWGPGVIVAPMVLKKTGDSLVVQWLSPRSQSRRPVFSPGLGTRSHMSQLKIPQVTTKTWHS